MRPDKPIWLPIKVKASSYPRIGFYDVPIMVKPQGSNIDEQGNTDYSIFKNTGKGKFLTIHNTQDYIKANDGGRIKMLQDTNTYIVYSSFLLVNLLSDL